MRLLERIPLLPNPEYRIACQEESLEAMAAVLIQHLEGAPEIESATQFFATQYAEVLRQVHGGLSHRFNRQAAKIEKLLKRRR